LISHIILSLIVLLACHAAASPLPDDPIPPPPDPLVKSDLTCRYVYISYPDAGADSLGQDLIDEVPAELEAFMDDQANGVYTYDIESVTVPNDTYATWMADYNTTEYIANSDSMTYNLAEACSGARGEVHAEILTEILAAYSPDNPFADCDYIFFIHAVKFWEGPEGIATTNLRSTYWQGILGSTLGFAAHRGNDADQNVKQTVLTLSAHEFGHNMHMPHPNYWVLPDGTVTYGVYDMMRTPLILSWGEPGLFPYAAMQLVENEWLSAETVTDEEHDLVLYDVQSSNRNAIVIPIENCGGQYANERFILSYHQQTGYDARHPSTGLQIWHDVPGHFSDIEAASGRWSGSLHDISDPIDGVDRLDRSFWDENDADPNHDKSDWNFNFTFEGNEDDFFDVNDTVTYPDGVEFSFNTNPSTWGSSGLDRQDPQSVKTTLFVRARPRDAQSIFVDVYPMPREEIATPVAGDSVAVGGAPMTVSWEHEFLNQGPDAINVLDQVQIWFSPHNGAPYSYQLVGTANHADTGFDWYPTGDFVTDQGKIKLVFTNDVNENTTETVMAGTVTVTGTATPWEALITPNGGEALYAGEAYDIQWTNYNAGILEQVDIRVATDGGTTWQAVALDATYSTVGDINVYSWSPGANLVGGQTRLKLTYHFTGGATAESISEADFSIYEIAARFSDVTSTSGLSYVGTPYAAADLEYNLDGKPDMFVTIQACEGCSPTEARSRLYRNNGNQSIPIRFLDRTLSDFASGSSTRNESLGLSVADYDSDGDRDVFVTHAESPQLFNLDNGQFTDVIDDTAVFDPADAELLQEGYCAVWVDFDHDGDLDLYLGRAASAFDPHGIRDKAGLLAPRFDTLFENRGSGATFLEVGQSVGLVDPTEPGVTMTAAWADMDDDGYWEVAVGGFGGSGADTRLFEENTDGSFSEVNHPFPASVDPSLVNSLQWVDFDRDNDLDLLMVRSEGPSYVLLNDSGELTDSVILTGGAAWSAAAGSAFDYNLDGYPDVAMANGKDELEPRLWQNLMGYDTFGDQPVVDVAAKVGLSDGLGLAQGVFANDLNGDGDLDLFLGRQASTGRMFQNESPVGSDLPVNHWLGFDLVAAGGNTAVGATVSLATASLQPLGMQMLDAGSGRGSQQPYQLIFGLGDLDESVDVVINWPSGREMTFSVAPAQFDNLMTVSEPTTFAIDDSTVDVHFEVRPYTNNLDWVFTWETDHWTEPGEDIVDIERNTGSGCAFIDATLQDGVTSGVTTRLYYQVDPVTGGVSYKHEVRWENRPCVTGCSYRYGVKSSLGTTTDSVPNTEPDLIRFKVCPSSI
jgi:M6 family metalloprotease-like protein